MPDDLFSGTLPAEILPPGEVADEEFLAQAEGQIRGYGKLVVSGIVEIGRKLVEVKGRVGYPGFVAFVTERLGWSERAGNHFVSVAEMFTAAAKFAVEDLTIDASSLYRIAAPSTPAEVREQVLEKAATPEGISRAEVENLVAAAKTEGGDAVRSQYEGKLVLTETELAATVEKIVNQYDAKITRLMEQRDSALDTVKKLRSKPPDAQPPEEDQPPPIDGTMSFRAASIRRALTVFQTELKITAEDFVKIEREVAARAHQKSADPELATICHEASQVVDWLADLLKICGV